MKNNILVIDDDEGIREAFTAMLESAGYNVQTAADPDILSNLSKDNLPDLIFLDVLLSGADGRVVCKKLKNREDTKNIPVIMISAAPDMEVSVGKAHADNFIRKPFEMDSLLAKVEEYIQN